jgi:hypothetical protein
VILRDGHPVGRFYVARWEREIRIVDIALLPEHRRAGIGAFLLRDILAEGTHDRKPVTIHVEQFNPAVTPTLVRIPYAAFSVGGGSGANLSSVAAIRLTVSASAAATVKLDFLRTGATAAPTPLEATLTDVVFKNVRRSIRSHLLNSVR